MPISLVGKTERVVDAPGLFIDELIGNVASKNDDISIAHVRDRIQKDLAAIGSQT